MILSPFPNYYDLLWTPSIIPNILQLPLIFFYSMFFLPPTPWLLLLPLALPLLFFASLLIPCIILLNWYSPLNKFSLKLVVVIWPHWLIPSHQWCIGPHCYGMLWTLTFFFSFYLFFLILYFFSFDFLFLFIDDEEACDIAVTW